MPITSKTYMSILHFVVCSISHQDFPCNSTVTSVIALKLSLSLTLILPRHLSINLTLSITIQLTISELQPM